MTGSMFYLSLIRFFEKVLEVGAITRLNYKKMCKSVLVGLTFLNYVLDFLSTETRKMRNLLLFI